MTYSLFVFSLREIEEFSAPARDRSHGSVDGASFVVVVVDVVVVNVVVVDVVVVVLSLGCFGIIELSNYRNGKAAT